jgi:hypothetical protein
MGLVERIKRFRVRSLDRRGLTSSEKAPLENTDAMSVDSEAPADRRRPRDRSAQLREGIRRGSTEALMGVRSKFTERRRRKAHRSYEQERERQAGLNREDSQQRVRDIANKTGPFAFPFGGGT